MNFFLVSLLTLSTLTYAQHNDEEAKVKLTLGQKISVVARGLKYLSAPALRGERGMEKITSKKAYKKWLKDLKALTDSIYGTQEADETQFGHAIALISERLENDQHAFSGYFSSGKKNKDYKKREKKLFQELSQEVAFNQVYQSLRASADEPEVRAVGPIYAYNLNYRNNDLSHLDRHQSIRDFLRSRDLRPAESCEVACPLSYGLLRINRAPMKIVYGEPQTQEDFTTFRNTPEDFNDYIKKQFGFCWGHSSLLFKFKRYVIFRPEAPRDSNEVLTKKIQTLMREQTAMVDINGFKNLQELSGSSEEIKKVLMAEVAREWARNALTIKNITSLKSAVKALDHEGYVNVYNEVLKRVLSNQLVQMKFNAHNVSGWSHIVNAYAVEEKEDEYRIYVQDPNIFPKDVPPEKSEKGNNFIAIKKAPAADGKGFAYYPPMKDVPAVKGNLRLGLVEVTPEGRWMALESVEKYKAICEEITQCQKEKKAP